MVIVKDQGSGLDNIPELILNNLPIGVIFCNTDCTIEFINRTYAEYLKEDRNEAIGKPITHYIPDSRLSAVLQTGKAELRDKCRVGTGGKTLPRNLFYR